VAEDHFRQSLTSRQYYRHPMAVTEPMLPDLGARARLEAAFAREERRGLMQAAAARSVAVAVIVVWLALANPDTGLAYAWAIATACFFLVTGLTQF